MKGNEIKRLMIVVGLLIAAMPIALIAEIEQPTVAPVYEFALEGGDIRVTVSIPNTMPRFVYKLMAADNEAFANPVEIVRGSAEGMGVLKLSGMLPDGTYLFFKVQASLNGVDMSEGSSGVTNERVVARPVLAARLESTEIGPLSDGTPAFEFVRERESVRVTVRLPKALPGILYRLFGSADVTFANYEEIARGSMEGMGGFELSGVDPDGKCRFFRVSTEASGK